MIRRRHFLAAMLIPAANRRVFAQASEQLPAAEIGALREVKRLCVEEFGGGETARRIRALVIAELHRMGAFVITENPRRADAFLRGFAEDLSFMERHTRDENVSSRASGSVSTGGYTRSRAAASRNEGGSASARESAESRRHEASLSIRIVTAEGDVLWSEAAESRGGKFRSASAEVAARVVAALEASIALEARPAQSPAP